MRGDDHPARGTVPIFAGACIWDCPLQAHPLPASLSAGGGEDGRHEVGEALADAGAGLDHQVVPLADRPLDGLGHGELFAAVFVVGQPGGDPSAGAEDFAG